MMLDSLGWQQRTKDYCCEGKKREHETGKCIFQYTLSGEGNLTFEDTLYQLNAGDAFLVWIPHEHVYELPETSALWEFLFVTLKGDYVNQIYRQLIREYGPVFSIPRNSPFFSFLMDFYTDACEKRYSTPYLASEGAYRFLMHLQNYLTSPANNPEEDSFINTAINYMTNHLADDISLDLLADEMHMSKYYFAKNFNRKVGMPPLQFLTKLRMETAAGLLVSTSLPIKEIALQCGYMDANYFHKAFRKNMGMSAGSFRESNQGTNDYTHLLL